MKRPVTTLFALGCLILLGAACSGAQRAPTEDLPPGVEQIIPRGRIPAVIDPEFVPAAQAEISDHAWVLGVEIGGQAKAYSLNLLNRHEVVNDRLGEEDFAAVW